MKREIFNIALVLMICLAAWLPLPAFAGEGNVRSEMEAQLIGYINRARQAPLETARAFGLDPQQILSRFSDHEEILLNGLPPLVSHPQLQAAAHAHAEDMIARAYFSQLSPDGQSVENRLLSKGYIANSSGEAIGMVGFQNFLPPEKAVRILFEGMIKDEFEDSREEPFRMLGSAYRQVGLSIASGRVMLKGQIQNVYIAVCDFADSDMTAFDTVESMLWRKINAARRNPRRAILDELGEEVTTLQALGIEDAEVYSLPPVARNQKLQSSAAEHGKDMIARLYYDTISPEGQRPVDRAELKSYHALLPVEEVLGVRLADRYVDPVEIAGQLFGELVKEEIYGDGEMTIFDANLSEVGISFQVSVVSAGDDAYALVYLIVADFARPADYRSFLIGNVYRDLNNNRIFDIGEGVSDIDLSVYPAFGNGANVESAVRCVTDGMGGYQLELLPSFLQVVDVEENGSLLEKDMVVGLGIDNEFKDIRIEE